jgi:5-methyltetrahydrofolate--homocysteine methyltransferase
MGTEILRTKLTPADYEDHTGCHEWLNLSRPDLIQDIHRRYLDAGCGAIETNTFGAHPLTLADHGLADQAFRLCEAGARLARAAAGPGALVFGSMGPGSKLPSLGHTSFDALRQGYRTMAEGLLQGGADRLLIETCQDLLQAKAAVLGARDADAAAHITVHVTIESTGTMLLGTETAAAAVALLALGIDGIGLNCATGPAEMSEHLRVLAALSDVPVSVMPNAGLPTIGPDGEATYDLTPTDLADWLERFVDLYGVTMVGGCCGTTPAHLAAVVARLAGRAVPDAVRGPGAIGQVSSLYQAVQLRQETSYLAVGERANANGSRVFREALLAGDLDACVQVARDQAAAGAHVLDLSVDYVGRDGVADMARVAAALATASTLPVMIDSTSPAVVQAALEHLGGRCLVNSVNFEDGDKPGSRFDQVARLARQHGAAVVGLTIDENGQARTAEKKVSVAKRLIRRLVDDYDFALSDIVIDPLTFPIGTGQAEARGDAMETLRAVGMLREQYPDVHLMLGVSNVSFGLAPAARVVLNSEFLDEATRRGLDVAIVRPGGIAPLDRFDTEALNAALNLVLNRRWEGYDPLFALIEACSGPDGGPSAGAAVPSLAGLPLLERIEQRVIQGARAGLEGDLDAALADGVSDMELVDRHLLTAMAEVGERFGAGRMQLPFVLQSAEVMKAAVAHLEPQLKTGAGEPKGTIVLATVAGDVHDIGKNLVDIVLTNNGYRVVNLGIKQPIGQILAAAEQHGADAIGLSGLLVKSTQVMRQNLAEMEVQGVAARWPVLLGGAALTRSFVTDTLAPEFSGRVYYAKDAFEALTILSGGATAGGVTQRPGRSASATLPAPAATPADGAPSAGVETLAEAPVPTPPFWGARQAGAIELDEYLPYLDKRTLFEARWGLKAGTGERTVAQLAETEGEPHLRALLEQVRADGLAQSRVAWGYFPARRQGDAVVVFAPDGSGAEVARFSFPRQPGGRRRCLADYVRADRDDVLALQLVTMGPRFGAAAQDLFQAGRYRDYLELHGLSVELTEALAEAWHRRIRAELGLPEGQGRRYSLGYPACPDLAGRRDIMRLLDGAALGLELTETLLLEPEQSTDALVFHHPEATYFSVRTTEG